MKIKTTTTETVTKVSDTKWWEEQAGRVPRGWFFDTELSRKPVGIYEARKAYAGKPAQVYAFASLLGAAGTRITELREATFATIAEAKVWIEAEAPGLPRLLLPSRSR